MTWARVITRIVAATDCQSATLGASGFSAGSASMSDGSTKRNSPSKRRSRRRTSVTVRQATRLASSPARGTHGGHREPLGAQVLDDDLGRGGRLAAHRGRTGGDEGEGGRDGGGPTCPDGRRRGS